MQIFVKTMTGMAICLEVAHSDSVGNVKAKIQTKIGIPKNLQRLVFSGQELEDAKTMSDCNVENASVIELSPNSIDAAKSLESLAKDVRDFRVKAGSLGEEEVQLEVRWRRIRRSIVHRWMAKKNEELQAMEEQELDLRVTVEEKQAKLESVRRMYDTAISQLQQEHSDENAGYARELQQLEDELRKADELRVRGHEAPRRSQNLIPECPVCLSAMLPPVQIYQCRRGHLICSTCKQNENCAYACPTCRDRFTEHPAIRCLFAENLAEKLSHQ